MKIKIIIIFVIFLSLLTSISFSESQPPTPSRTKLSQPQQNEPSPKKTHARNDQCGTDDLPFIIKIVPAPATKTEKDDDATNTDYKSTLTNILLVIFNGLLAVFTFFLWWSTRKLWKSTEKSADLTYKAFIATNRPRLRIRHINFDGFIQSNIGPTWIEISNVGGSEAKNIKLFAVFALKNEGFKVEPWTENLSKSIWYGKNVLAPGEEATHELRSKPDVMPSIMEIGFNRQVLSIIGKIRYKDANATERETSFGWTYDPKTFEFSKPEKEDQYNYEN